MIMDAITEHHRYLQRTLPYLRKLMTRVARLHGTKQTSLYDLDRVFDTLAVVLGDHIAKEEQYLFPALSDGTLDEHAMDVLSSMRAEHDDVDMLLSVLRAIADDYIAPDWASNSYRTLLAELAYLEADTLRNVHLENDVLLPRLAAAHS